MSAPVWTNAALANLRAIRGHIEKDNPAAAQKIAASLFAAGNSLAHFPHRGRRVADTTMRELIADYRYVIRYRIQSGVVTILRVRHTSRRQTAP